MRKLLILVTASLFAFAGMNAASAGSLSSPWDEPEITRPLCTPMGILYTTLWYSCPTADTPYTRDRPDRPDTPNTPDTPDRPDTPDTPDRPDRPDRPEKPNKPEKPSKPKSNASNHASEKADNNDGKGGKDRDTSKNNDKGTHGNRSP